MRLIDADTLNFERKHCNKSQIKAMLDFVDAQPTAYDTEKVIEQLNDLPTFKVSATSEKHPFSAYEAEMISKHKVMGIVKKGGVE